MEKLRETVRTIREIRNQNHELIWAKTWDDTRRGIPWMEDFPGISPGRWAVGYNYLYVMTRILNEKEPRAVLDIGLGISSTLISRYFSYLQREGAIHDIVEQDPALVDFYLSKRTLSPSSAVHVRPCVEVDRHGERCNAYQDFESVVSGKRYDVISIDAPKGSPRYSRMDVVPHLPGILSDSFVIVMDDAQRPGERDAIDGIRRALKDGGVRFCEGWYPGMTTCAVITSEDNRFICSM